MLGINVLAKVTYCRHTLQAEAKLNVHGEWVSQCTVEGPVFEGTITLSSPVPSPKAALDAILAAARRSIDERDTV